jgi:hypothetical protein
MFRTIEQHVGGLFFVAPSEFECSLHKFLVVSITVEWGGRRRRFRGVFILRRGRRWREDMIRRLRWDLVKGLSGKGSWRGCRR